MTATLPEGAHGGNLGGGSYVRGSGLNKMLGDESRDVQGVVCAQFKEWEIDLLLSSQNIQKGEMEAKGRTARNVVLQARTGGEVG